MRVIFGTSSRTAGLHNLRYFDSALYLSGTNGGLHCFNIYVISLYNQSINFQACTHTQSIEIKYFSFLMQPFNVQNTDWAQFGCTIIHPQSGDFQHISKSYKSQAWPICTCVFITFTCQGSILFILFTSITMKLFSLGMIYKANKNVAFQK